MTPAPPHGVRSSLEVPDSNGGRRTAPNGGYAGIFPKDPRISSAQSLVPTPSEYRNSGKRRLLVVYIHGYQGTDTSFQSFPAHVHHFLKRALADTHVVHSKIYPRYKTYKAIDIARDNFSAWLEPHESPTTDVVLVGHSMGGLLNAEIVLTPSRTPYTTGYFRHRILGTVNLDAPFLGLHPGIIMSGISSLFRPKQKPARESTTELDSSPGTSGIASPNSSTYSGFSALTPAASTPSAEPRPRPQGFPFPAMTFDPNFNPAFSNDVRLQDRGWVQNLVHFVKKHHSEGLIDAATHHFMSHLEYGSTLLDFNCLKSRYESLRKLEDIDDLKQEFPYGPRQVRFVQYYTMCYGFPKKRKHNKSQTKLEAPEVLNPTYSNISTPRISVQDHSRGETEAYLLQEANSSPGPPSKKLSSLELGHANRESGQEHEEGTSANGVTNSQAKGAEVPSPIEPIRDSSRSMDSAFPPRRSSAVDTDTAAELVDAVSALHLDLPVIPELPPKPEIPDKGNITNKDERKQAEKDAKQKQKAYDQAVKTREKAIRDRQKTIDKREKKRLQEAEKRRKEELKLKKKGEVATASAVSLPSESQALATEAADTPAEPKPGPIRTMTGVSIEEYRVPGGKKRKERKFCNLPSTHKVNGQLDPKWVKVFMKDTDEVGAHTSLFYPGEHYDRLVNDVIDVIVGWVQEDASKRAILEMRQD
ncbi:hypothetical protein DL766_000895 [Monosporascus sp. MC13-8B]|uniref:DUF676 domain-containing protein n=1 Tax=Monosporascus cannonballus TaxID=155416 RepID=A0ABY0HAY5_9PEZI|nr:hypothetical protein DL762_003281 [Monosporascus cannonballus]RYP00775.1 hypothetical protein DL763_000655 [Monosporascus cannonballus]RYP38478.1 hypothetical protein DL766_000895 [Monosporascus sp. MC13-8B]